MDFEKLVDIIAQVMSVDPREISESTTFAEDLGADSLDLYQILLAVEETFDISIDTDNINSIKTVGEAYRIITGR